MLVIGGSEMNDDILKGKWKQVKGNVKKQWGKLTNDDLDKIKGDSEKLIGKIQEKYGTSKDAAAAQVKKFKDKL